MTLQNWANVSKKLPKIGLKSAGDIFAMRLLCDNDEDFVKFVENCITSSQFCDEM